MQYPVPGYRPVKPHTGPCPCCEGARYINNADGTTRWTAGPNPTTPGQTRCPVCQGTGVFEHRGVN